MFYVEQMKLMLPEEPITSVIAPSAEAKARLGSRLKRIIARLGAHEKELVGGAEHNEQIAEAFLEGFDFALQENKQANQVNALGESAYALIGWSDRQVTKPPPMPTMITSTGAHTSTPLAQIRDEAAGFM